MSESLFIRLYDQKTAGQCIEIFLHGREPWIKRKANLATDKKKGKPSQKTFEDHSFIKRSAKFVKKCKTCEFLEISREIHHE